jgi:subfamily B ATP-binding cassette protein MsbA
MKQFFPYFRLLLPVKGKFILAIVFAAIYGASNGAGLPFMLKQILPKVFQNGQELETWVLIGTVAYLPMIFFVRGFSGFMNSYLINFCGLRVLEEVRLQLFRRIQHLSLGAFQRKKSGDLYSRILTDTHELQTAVTTVANDIIKQPITLVSALGYLVYECYNREETVFILFSLIVVPLCVLPIRYIGKNLLKRAIQMQEESANLSQVVQENLQGAKEVRAFSLEQKEINRFTESIRKFFRYQLKVVKYMQALTPSIEVITAFGISGSIYYAAKSGIGFEELMPLLTALYMSYEPIKKLGAISNNIKRGQASLERIEEIINLEDPVVEPQLPLTWDSPQGRIAFRGVDFQYSDTPVLKGINLEIEEGEVVALVGPSGAGKSTIAQMIPRFYDPVQGTIEVDGFNLKELSKDNIRKNVAIVSQDPVLFNDTIYANVLLGNPSADKEAVIDACKRAYAHDFILEQENGYETITGDRGARLSGGQKQRISIARAFLKDSPILILDEATSALDSESEMKIQLALNELVQNKTVIIIAHRFSTIQMANRIVVLNQGEIVGIGKHKDLIEDCETYRTLYELQN